ncbi:C-type mannose receptor 2-like [Gigantopelta aegis]|uniref:C-type mannose receptor 2-like n=1 Tax=Gigantopelta aegis TaxID=1735272 RepID=UPI001B88E342|nr:C-type mannose receptor 2-like [Gigantopelta aegis]
MAALMLAAQDELERRRARRRERVFRDRFHPLDMYNDLELYQRYRLDRRTILDLIDAVGDVLDPHTVRNHALSSSLNIFEALRFYATGSFQQVTADTVHVSQPTMSRVISQVTHALLHLLPTIVNFPMSEDIPNIVQDFYEIAHFPSVAYCQSINSYFVIITSAEEDKFIREHLLQSTTKSDYWIGANDQQVEGQFQWMSTGSHKPVNYTNWSYRQPDNKDEEDCVELRAKSGFPWNDAKCNKRTGFICEHSQKTTLSDTCQPGFVKYENSCYWFSPKSAIRSWDEGKAYCQSINSYLVIITSAEEDKFIREYLLQSTTKSDYWIGANDQQVEGQFQWMSTGSHKPVNYTNWSYRQPDNKDEEDCVELRAKSGFPWNDAKCNKRTGFICEHS